MQIAGTGFSSHNEVVATAPPHPRPRSRVPAAAPREGSPQAETPGGGVPGLPLARGKSAARKVGAGRTPESPRSLLGESGVGGFRRYTSLCPAHRVLVAAAD